MRERHRCTTQGRCRIDELVTAVAAIECSSDDPPAVLYFVLNHCDSLCSAVLAPGGEVHVTLKMAPPYSEWGIPALAGEAGLVLYDTYKFEPSRFPGYHHQTTERGAAELDTDSVAARRLLRTLSFRRKKAGEPSMDA